MKKLSISLFTIIALALFLVSWTTASKYDGAVHIGPTTCGVLDGDGNIILADGNAVITPFGNGNLKCQVKLADNSTGRAVTYDYENTGLLCNVTGAGLTDKWHETVSKSGNVTLQCKYQP